MSMRRHIAFSVWRNLALAALVWLAVYLVAIVYSTCRGYGYMVSSLVSIIVTYPFVASLPAIALGVMCPFTSANGIRVRDIAVVALGTLALIAMALFAGVVFVFYFDLA